METIWCFRPDQSCQVWGTAAAGTSVQLQWLSAEGEAPVKTDTIADAKGHWRGQLPPLSAGKTGQLQVTAGSETKTFQDVEIGETWLCGGQSNMEYPLSGALNAKKDIPTANDPDLRLFLVPHQSLWYRMMMFRLTGSSARPTPPAISPRWDTTSARTCVPLFMFPLA